MIYFDLNNFGQTLGDFVDLSFREPFCFESNDFGFGLSFFVVQIFCDCFDSDYFDADKNFKSNYSLKVCCRGR